MKLGSFPDAAARLEARDAITASVILAILYGSLYPFSFYHAGSPASAFLHLLGTWHQAPQSRGDTLANFLLYMPLGFTLTLAFMRRGAGYAAAASAALGAGAALSFLIELAQFYDASRVSTLSDVYLNAAGTAAGAIMAALARTGLSRALWPTGSAAAFARLLLLAWMGWRLYPYVPTVDLHKYWNSLKPVLFAANIGAYTVSRYALLWLSVIFLLQLGFAPKRLLRLVVPVALAFFAAKIVILGQVLSLPEILGAGLAMLLSRIFLLRRRNMRIKVLAALCLALVVLPRLLPWRLAVEAKPFQWVPFFGFLHGSLQVNVISFAEKFYMYGVVLLLLMTAGMTLRKAVALQCSLLLATSLLQVLLVNRSAEITDAILALVLGGIYAVLRRAEAQTAGANPQPNLL